MQPKSVHLATASSSAPIGQEAAESAYDGLMRAKEGWRAEANRLSGELVSARLRIARLEADLHECREYLENEMDVVDGDYGQPAPNRAMQLMNMIDETLNGPGNF